MNSLTWVFGVALLSGAVAGTSETLFKGDFEGGLGDRWTWISEDPRAWRATCVRVRASSD